MKQYALLYIRPVITREGLLASDSVPLAECLAISPSEAIDHLQPACPCELDARGYAEIGPFTYYVVEFFS